MGKGTKIQWCDDTFNCWIGCDKVSPGCAHCYAAVSYTVKMQGIKWGKGQPRHRTGEDNWKKPLAWNKKPWVCDFCGHCMTEEQSKGYKNCPTGFHLAAHHRRRVFCASLADWLDDEVPIEWLADFLKLIHDTPNLDWLNLTKRPQNWKGRITAAIQDLWSRGLANRDVCRWLEAWLDGRAPQNIWIGTTTEDQQRANERIPELLKIPAHVRFLSVEPMLAQINLGFHLSHIDRQECGLVDDPLAATLLQQACDEGRGSAPSMIHWVIFGGESGPNARGCDVAWIHDGVKQCRAAGVKVFVKQLGAKPYQSPEHEGATGYALPLKDRKGSDIEEWPADLRIREFPSV